MGNILSIMVNSFMEEMITKIKRLGYHTYKIDIEKNLTVTGLSNSSSSKIKFLIKHTTIIAEELFVLDDVSLDAPAGLFCISITVPKILIKIGRVGFTCSDPKLAFGVTGQIHVINTNIILNVCGGLLNDLKLDSIKLKPKIKEIQSDVQLLVNKRDYSQLANSVISSVDPGFVNGILEYVLNSQEDAIKQFINTQLQEVRTSFKPSFD